MRLRLFSWRRSNADVSVRRCPICDGVAFEPFHDRPRARCASCQSLERTRYLWLFLTRTKLLGPGMRVLHVSPERCLSARIRGIVGDGYDAADLDPDRYRTPDVDVRRLDLCNDIAAIGDSRYDLLMHLHVLEHLPCRLDFVLAESMRILTPGGRMIFAVPIGRGRTTEDWSPKLTPAERTRLFGQSDHVRQLGRADFPAMIETAAGPYAMPGPRLLDPDSFADREILEAAAIPYDRAKEMTGTALFQIRKRL
jgi:SAM-dependent methyltransferase